MQWLICIGLSFITFILSIFIKFIPLDVCIQNILDNISKGNKVAGIDDLVNKDNLIEDNNENNGKNNSKISGSVIDILRKKTNTSMDISFREKKPNIVLAYD